MNNLPTGHFLSLPRPDQPPVGVVDTTTLAAHDFDVDTRTGFMPPQPPLSALPLQWEPWELTLNDAIQRKLQLGDKIGLLDQDAAHSESWRASVRQLPILPTTDLKKSELVLRRAHHVLARILHFYIHTLPPTHPINIPPPLTIPLLQVSAHLHLPPVLTYSDTVLYNWALKSPSNAPTPALDNLSCPLLFTSTPDEEEFNLTPARIELRGVEILDLMQVIMDEIFVGDAIALRRVTLYLSRIALVIHDLKTLLLAQPNSCHPHVFYRDIRPWLRGADSDVNHRPWVFDGLNADPDLRHPTELSGPSAGQSSLMHALDIFLGIDALPPPSQPENTSFFTRMRLYMPRHHRAFLSHLAAAPRPLRALVLSSSDTQLTESYNAAVLSLKQFRDAHMSIIALYIVIPASRSRSESDQQPLKGTGGTDLVKFLKTVRDNTKQAFI